MKYYDWQELATEVLGCSSTLSPTFKRRILLQRATTRLEEIFNGLSDSKDILELRNQVRAWVTEFYDKYGHKMDEAPVFNSLIELEDDNAYARCLTCLLPILWD